MLAEWLEKEAQVEMVKTAAQQFEEELSVLDAPSIAQVWRNARTKEANVIPGALGGALGGGLAGGLYGGLAGGVGGAMGAQPGQRGEGFWQGAGAGAPMGAISGGLGGALGGAMMGGSAVSTPQGVRFNPQDVSNAQALASLSQLGGAAVGGAKGYKEVKKKGKKKESSVNIMRLALMKKAGLFQRMGNVVQRGGRS